MKKHFGPGSITIILITLILFVVALFVKGITQELLLEAGVFLVSVKLIIMTYKSSIANKEISRQLKEIKDLIDQNNENSSS